METIKPHSDVVTLNVC